MDQLNPHPDEIVPTDVGSQPDAASLETPSATGSNFEAEPPTPDWPRRPPSVRSFSDLPEYARSLLKIELPLAVTLATSRQSIGRIVKLTPGSILQFNKSCDEMVELSVGDQAIAAGKAVQVGDKFGIRIESILLPEERFGRVTRAATRTDSQP
jgi:flagellar motor switch protein FliN/FliY